MSFTPLPRGPESWCKAFVQGAILGGIVFFVALVVIHTCTGGWLRQYLEDCLAGPTLLLSSCLYLVSLISLQYLPQRFAWRLAIVATLLVVFVALVNWLRPGVYD